MNAFADDFLKEAACLECPTLGEARFCGPWRVESKEESWAVIEETSGDVFAVVRFRETALMLAAVLPSVGRQQVYGFAGRALKTTLGESGLRSIGEVRDAEELILPFLHAVHCILSSPRSLALLLLAAPSEALERSGSEATGILKTLVDQPKSSELE